MADYAFQKDLDAISTNYTQSINAVTEFIQTKRSTQVKATDKAKIKQVKEKLKGYIQKIYGKS